MEINEEEQFELISDEIKVLHSIFCGQEEFLLNGSPPDTSLEVFCRNLIEGKIRYLHLSVTVHISCTENIKVLLGLSLGKQYPYSLPEISVSSLQLTRKKLEEIHKMLRDHAVNLMQCPGPIVLKLINWLQDNVVQLCSSVDTPESENDISFSKDEKRFIVFLQFDHMRSRKKYLKTISNWAKELDLNGYILFFAKNIFAVVEGLKFNINKLLKYLRTSIVDVDSAGKACKERMMKLVCEFEKTEQHRYCTMYMHIYIYIYTFIDMILSDIYIYIYSIYSKNLIVCY